MALWSIGTTKMHDGTKGNRAFCLQGMEVHNSRVFPAGSFARRACRSSAVVEPSREAAMAAKVEGHEVTEITKKREEGRAQWFAS